MQSFFHLFNYGAAIFLALFGIYAMITRQHLIHKIIGMTILQVSVILFYISISFKNNASIPILQEALRHGNEIHAVNYANPLPHALMLTAIVVGVATLGVALVLAIGIYRDYQTLEEDEILNQMGQQK